MFIRYNAGHETVEYAVSELERLLRKSTGIHYNHIS